MQQLKLKNPLPIALTFKRLADEFVRSFEPRRPVIFLSLFSPVYTKRDIRTAFLKGGLACLEELRRQQLLDKEERQHSHADTSKSKEGC